MLMSLRPLPSSWASSVAPPWASQRWQQRAAAAAAHSMLPRARVAVVVVGVQEARLEHAAAAADGQLVTCGAHVAWHGCWWQRGRRGRGVGGCVGDTVVV